MASETRDVAIVGLGRFGASLAVELTRLGDRVLGLDIEEPPVLALGDEIDTVAQGDARDIKVLEQLSLEEYDAVMIAIGEDMEASLVTTMNALELGCGQFWVKAHSAMHERILRQLGVNNIVQPEKHAGLHMAQMLHNPLVRDYIALRRGHYIVKVDVQEELVGRTLEEIDQFDGDLKCLVLDRDGKLIDPDDESLVLEEKDILVLQGTRETVGRIGAAKG